MLPQPEAEPRGRVRWLEHNHFAWEVRAMGLCNCLGNPLSASSRRDFLVVGAVGGLGFVLGDLLAVGDGPSRRVPERQDCPRPRAFCTSSCPAESPSRNRSIPSLIAPLEYRGSLGVVKTKLPGEVFCETWRADGRGGRQTLRRPLHEPRRSGPRARHAQHVHRLSPQPGNPVSQPGQRRQPRTGHEEQPSGLRLRAEHAQSLCGHRLPQFVLRSVQPRGRSGARRISRPRSGPAQRRRRRPASRAAARQWTR